jgi:MFS superfamily sulfate permease-like transporter
MGCFKLGILSSLLSDSLMSGFTTGAAVHVLTSQVPHLFGFRIQKFTGPGRLVKVLFSRTLFGIVLRFENLPDPED